MRKFKLRSYSNDPVYDQFVTYVEEVSETIGRSIHTVIVDNRSMWESLRNCFVASHCKLAIVAKRKWWQTLLGLPPKMTCIDAADCIKSTLLDYVEGIHALPVGGRWVNVVINPL